MYCSSSCFKIAVPRLRRLFQSLELTRATTDANSRRQAFVMPIRMRTECEGSTPSVYRSPELPFSVSRQTEKPELSNSKGRSNALQAERLEGGDVAGCENAKELHGAMVRKIW